MPRFDEYNCAENIDLKALKRLPMDLQTDCKKRARIGLSSESLEKLKRCKILELLGEDVHGQLKDLVPDKNGCVVHEVVYEHRDASLRGRLFAKGRSV
jgi:hypothetical protein